MMVRVKLFAAARELAGVGEVVVEVADDATIADVQDALLATAPRLREIVPHARWAMDESFASLKTPVVATSQIALIPPVSGG